MKILWLSHVVPYPPKRGVLIRAYHLVRELSRYHDVHLVALNQRSLIEPYFDTYEAGCKKSKDALEEYCSSVDIISSPGDRSKYFKLTAAFKSLIPGCYPYTVGWLQIEEFKRAVDRALEKTDFDVIHCDTISLATYVSGLDKKFIQIMDHHNIESHMLDRRSKQEKNFAKSLYFRFEARKLRKFERICRDFDLNITCSDLDAERLIEIDGDIKTFTVPNSVDVDAFSPIKMEPDPYRIVFIGTLSWYPNLAAVEYIAAELWGELKASFPEVSIDVIGANPPASLVEFSRENKGFNVLGFVDDIATYLHSSALYLCPISDGGGTKLKLLDAFSAGKAVVAHPIACEGLEVTDGHNVLLCSNKAEFLQSIRNVFESIELRKKLENNAREHAVDNFSAKAIVKTFSDKLIELSQEKL